MANKPETIPFFGPTPTGAGKPPQWMIDAASRVHRCSKAQLEILRGMGQALSTEELCHYVVHRSPKTVDAHVDTLKKKLELPSSLKLRGFAVLWYHGMVPPAYDLMR